VLSEYRAGSGRPRSPAVNGLWRPWSRPRSEKGRKHGFGRSWCGLPAHALRRDRGCAGSEVLRISKLLTAGLCGGKSLAGPLRNQALAHFWCSPARRAYRCRDTDQEVLQTKRGCDHGWCSRRLRALSSGPDRPRNGCMPRFCMAAPKVRESQARLWREVGAAGDESRVTPEA